MCLETDLFQNADGIVSELDVVLGANSGVVDIECETLV